MPRNCTVCADTHAAPDSGAATPYRHPFPLCGAVASKYERIEGAVPAQVHVNIRGIHLDPASWPDPTAFKPERFLGTDLASSRAYLPFGSGPHNCIGYRFATLEALTLLVHLYSRYTFRLDATAHPKGDLHLIVRMTMAPQHGICVVATPRGSDAFDTGERE